MTWFFKELTMKKLPYFLLLNTSLLLSIATAQAEPIVVIVSATSPVAKVDKEQVANLFLGP